MRTGIAAALFICLGLVCDSSTPSAQSSSAAQSERLEAARQAHAAGRPDEALMLADQVLEAAPTSRAAVELKIDVLLAGDDLDAALDAYEAFSGAVEREDPALLAALARAHLRALTRDASASVSVPALQHLAAAGDPNARAALVRPARTARDSGEGRLALEALARLGDERARDELVALLSEGGQGSRLWAINAVQKIGDARAVPALRQALGQEDELIRARAAEALGVLRAREAARELEALLQDPSFVVRLFAAAALVRIGESAGAEMMRNALASSVPDAQLLAARALAHGMDKTWVRVVRPLLQDPDGLNRLIAAELLLPEDPGAAVDILYEAVEDPNPVIRAEAARVLAAAEPVQAAALRPLLRDESPSVRLHASTALVGRATDAGQ